MVYISREKQDEKARIYAQGNRHKRLKELSRKLKKNPQEFINTILKTPANNSSNYESKFGENYLDYLNSQSNYSIVELFDYVGKDTKEKLILDFIGDYLVDNNSVLEELVQRSYRSSDFKKSLNGFLKIFNFPRDIEKITKLVEGFSDTYHRLNSVQNPSEIYEET